MFLYPQAIPEFLRSSPYLEVLQSEGPIPETGIEVPDGCLKEDMTVATKEDLQSLLHTLRFWLLPELTESCVDLMHYALNPGNKADFMSCLAEFQNDLPFVCKLSSVVQGKPEEKVARAAQNGLTNVVKYLVEKLHNPVTEKAGSMASKAGELKCLKYLHSRGLKLSADVCFSACCGGHQPCVKYMIDHKAKNYLQCAQNCAAHGHFECVKLAVSRTSRSVDRQSPAILASYQRAVICNQLACLEQMMVEWPDPEYMAVVVTEAIKGGAVEILELAVQTGLSLSAVGGDLVTTAAEYRNLECLQYLHEHGCPLTDLALYCAADTEQRAMFYYLIEHNCPPHDAVCTVLARENNLELLKYAHEHGCPWDERTCEEAALHGQLACLKYAHENGCPWRVEQVEPAADSMSVSSAGDGEESHDSMESEDENEAGDAEDSDSSEEWEEGEEEDDEWEGNEFLVFDEEEEYNPQDITLSAAQAPTVDCLLYVIAQGVPQHPDCPRSACNSRCVETLQFLHLCGSVWDEEDCAAVATFRSVECLRFLHEIGTPWDARTCSSAAGARQLQCLQYAHEHGCPWDEETTRLAEDPACYEYAVALLSEGPIPEGGIEIPDGCLKQDLTLSTQQDLTDLLHTLRFWRLPELLFESTELLQFAFKPVNHEYFLCAAEEFQDVFPFLVEMSEIVRREPQERVEYAINHLHVVKFLVEELGTSVTEKAGFVAAQEGKVECLQYLHSRGMALSCAVCDAACVKGHVECVKYTVDVNTYGYWHSLNVCAANGHFECVKYVIQKMAPDYQYRGNMIDSAFRSAADKGHFSCLQKMLEEWNDEKHVRRMAKSAVRNGHLDVLKFAVDRGVDVTQLPFILEKAASGGHLSCVQYLHERGCGLSAEVLSSAAYSGDQDTFKYLIEHNCPADTATCNTLAYQKFLELLQYARQHGCPWDEDTCASAAEAGNLAVLQYLHTNGCPWSLENIPYAVSATPVESSHEDGDTTVGSNKGLREIFEFLYDQDNAMALQHITRSAARAPTVDCLIYLVEQGLTLDPHCGALAARSKCVDTLRYLHSQGFTWNDKDCAAAANREAVECLMFLHEIGTPWDEKTCKHAGSVECYEYAVANGCPGAELSYFYTASQKFRL